MTTKNIKELNEELVKKEKEYAKSKMNVIEAKNKHSTIFSELIIMRRNFKESQKNIVSETKETIIELRKEWFYDTYNKKEIYNLLPMIREGALSDKLRYCDITSKFSDKVILEVIPVAMSREDIRYMMNRVKKGNYNIHKLIIRINGYLRRLENKC